jgi:aminoglycoside 6-adenylyltransferase
MRNEQEVLEQVLTFALQSDLIRATVLNGSRVNPNVTKDLFCDYDVACIVTDPEPFLSDRTWIGQFGDLIMMQQNEFADTGGKGYIFLMLFTDGVRIDLSFHPIKRLDILLQDSLTVVLLDKDRLIEALPPATDTSYLPQKPDRQTFDAVINEFWWCSTNVAKGLWRDERCYTKYMFEAIVRDALLTMLSWYVGIKHDWQVNPGKFGRWLKTFLPPEIWESLEKTYAAADYNAIWEAMFEAGKLVRIIGLELADAFGYEYPLQDDVRVTEYWQRVRALPHDAETFI